MPVPVSATLVEAINLLQTGAIDCVFGTAGWYRSFGYADFLTHHTDYPMGMTGPATGWLMNRDAWSQLSPEEQELHLRKGAMVSAMQAFGQFVEEERAALDWATREKGVEVVTPDEPQSFAALMEDFIADQDQAVIAAAEDMGVEDPQALIATYRENFDKWKGLTDGVTDVDALADLYWQEIYSQVDRAAL